MANENAESAEVSQRYPHTRVFWEKRQQVIENKGSESERESKEAATACKKRSWRLWG
jgi:hypothetical protein